MIEIPVSPGELLDKISILEIKARRIRDPHASRLAERELALLRERCEAARLGEDIAPLFDELRAVNERLWEIEDAIRECERKKCFDDHFIRLARSVYINNDTRASIKRRINERTRSPIREVKSYY